MGKFITYTQTEYAKIKSVSRPYITKLVRLKKLKTHLCADAGKYLIIDCDENDMMFKK